MYLVFLNSISQLIPTLLWWPIVYAIMKKLTKKGEVSWFSHLIAIVAISLFGGLIYNSFVLVEPEIRTVILAAIIPIVFSILAFFCLPKVNVES